MEDARASAGRAVATLRVDPLQAEPIVDALVEMDWLARLDEPGSARYVLLVDPAATPATPLLAQMLLEPTPMLRAFRERAGFDRLTPNCCRVDRAGLVARRAVLHTVLAEPFGGIHRVVGGLQQLEAGAACRSARDRVADARADAAAGRPRRRPCAPPPACAARSSAPDGPHAGQHEEPVAAEVAHRVVGAHALLQRLRHLDEQGIALAVVAEAVSPP